MKKNKKAGKKTAEQLVFESAAPKESKILENGVPTIKDMMAPPSFDRTSPDHIQVGNKFVRNFIIAGYPKQIPVGWADQLYNYEGDLDLAIHINPTDERVALDELTNKITQFQAQLDTEVERGSNRNITRLQSIINGLYEERAKVEQNYISVFGVQMIMNLYTDSLEMLNKESQLLENGMRGRKVKLMPMYLQQSQGYKSALPFGKTWLPRNYRNFTSEALTACFPFYNSEVSHETGVFAGINLQTATPIYIDFFDRAVLNNGNMTVFGASGSGKTFFVSLLVMRSALKQVQTVIIDPESDYIDTTEAAGGVVMTIAAGSESVINPFDIEEEDELNGDDKATGRKVVRIKDKVSDLLNLVGVMCGGLEQEQQSLLSYVLTNVYESAGFTSDPRSLYVDDVALNARGEFVHNGRKKPMPTFSDFHRTLEKFAEDPRNECLRKVANTLRMFRRDGVYGLFDTQTSESLQDFKNAPIITFDVSKLEENILRPIGMYIALSWAWEKFAKKNLHIKKRIVCDEAWMLTKESMAGHEYTAKFLEVTARRIRKRNGSLLVSSQNFREFASSDEGMAVLANTGVRVFMKQTETDIDEVQNRFKLSDGERNFLSTAKRGHFLLKMNEESTVGYAFAFEYEKYLIEKRFKAT